jgi:hypothetical protein
VFLKITFLRTMPRFLVSLAVIANAAAQQVTPTTTATGSFQISGTLVDSLTGQPIARARMAVAPVTKRDNFTTVITGEDGLFSFAKLTPGKYVLTAQARGYLLQSFNQHEQFASSIVVGPDSDAGHLLFRLPPAGAIAGVVTDEAGEPVREAQVALYFTGLSAGSDTARSRGRTLTDDQGAFHFGHLAPGHYLVAVSARPWYAQHPTNLPGTDSSISLLDVAYPVTFHGGATDAAMATPLTLAPGDKATANIALQPVPALRVRVSTDSGDSGRGTHVAVARSVLDGPPLPVLTEIRSAGPGQQEIVGIPPGRYTLTTLAAGGTAPPEQVSSREIDINANGEIDKSQGTAYVPVTAKLQFDPGTQPRQTYLQLLNKKSRAVTSQPVSDEGEIVFKQGVLPGSYEVSITNAPGFYLKSISAAGATITGRTIEVRPGAAVKLAISAVRGQGQITGAALRESKPFAGAMIVLVPADPAHNQVLFRRDQSDSDGSFTLPDVVPGAYTLLALENGWELAWMDPAVLKNYLGRGVAVQVQPNGKYEVKVDVQ